MTKTIRASEIGAKLDSNVRTGGGTDDTAVLQKALDEAKCGGVHLILDGAALVKGLVVHSNTTIECPNKDCGLFLADNANDAILKNADPDMENIKNRNIRILGGTYNGNCKNQEHHIDAKNGDIFISPSVLPVFGGKRWMMGFLFTGVENLEISNMIIRDCRTFAMAVGCFRHVTMEDVWVDIPNHIIEGNQDGLHFWGDGQFLTLKNIRGFSGDDFIALNTDELKAGGSITDVLIDGVMIDGATRAIRFLSRDNGRIDRVTVRNVTGTYKGWGFFIEPHFPDSETGGNIGCITFENINLRPFDPLSGISTPGMVNTPFLFNINVTCEHLIFRNIIDHLPDCQRNLFQIWYNYTKKTKIRKITIDGLTILKDGAIEKAPIEIDVPVESLTIRNVDISCTKESPVPFITFGKDGYVGTLCINGMVTTGMKTIDDAKDDVIGKKIIWNTELS